MGIPQATARITRFEKKQFPTTYPVSFLASQRWLAGVQKMCVTIDALRIL